MTLSITPANPARSDFVGVVTGLDLARPVDAATAALVGQGMDRFGVLVFHGQRLEDAQQIGFSRHFGELEMATGDLT